MAQSNDFICDLTGEVIRLAAVPVAVRIQVAVVPGALVDPSPESLPPFLRQMLVNPDGSARPGVLELGAAAFNQHFTIDAAALTPAFAGPPPEADAVAQLQATVEALTAAAQVRAAELHDLKQERDQLVAERVSRELEKVEGAAPSRG